MVGEEKKDKMEMKEKEEGKAGATLVRIKKRVAENFRKSKMDNPKKENPTKEYLLVQNAYLFVSVIAVLVVVGFLTGWFTSRYHHSSSSEPDEVSGVGGGGQHCKESEATKHSHSCQMFMVCRNGQQVEETCPKFHHFDSRSSMCLWIHLSDCGKEVEDVPPLTPEVTTKSPPPTQPPSQVTVPTLTEVLNTEVNLVLESGVGEARMNMRTLHNNAVEAVSPGLLTNPYNVRIVERIVSQDMWEYLFPLRDKAYSYRNFLKSVGKFPSFCAHFSTCPETLAVLFAHVTQETGAHTRSGPIPEWRQGFHYVEEVGCSNGQCGYSSNCLQDTWLTKTWPCGKKPDGKLQSYHGRGAKQISYNYNYGQFSSFVFGNATHLLDHPELITSTWLALASAIWFFIMPQPPKPSMLAIVEGRWKPNNVDVELGLKPGFGLTTNIINGGVECGKGSETPQSVNRQSYYRHFSSFFNLTVSGETGCRDKPGFTEQGAGALKLFWEQDWSRKYKCQLVSYHTSHSALLPGDYKKCVEKNFNVEILKKKK